jgi:hypothetical protein
MHQTQITNDLKNVSFEFFYWFSRFEFALKENGYLKDTSVGAKAEPSWKAFVDKWSATYVPTAAALKLMAESPKRQVVGLTGLEFRPVGFDDNPSELGKVVRLASTVRNNLFHGGKHGYDNWDDPARTEMLLNLVITLLHELAAHASIENDYRREY